MLTFQQVEKRFGPRPILNIPSLHLDTGIYWLQGANGSGKSTLLRILAGILPFRGEITLLGHPLHKDPTGYRRLIGWAEAEPLYPAFLTGAHLLNFYTGILHPDESLTQRLMDSFGVRPFLNTRTTTWSSGMIKKLALLLAFLGRPSLLLLDEPLITLDEAAIAALLKLIHEFHATNGASFLISSHLPIPGAHRLALKNETIQLED